jgi:RimJ/RimL family protein N-acetyltransferase
MTVDDLPHLHRWLNNPDVANWYGLGVENVRNPTLEQVTEHYTPRIHGQTPTTPYIMLLDGAPIGYIQDYRIGDYPGYAATLDHDNDAIGIDLLIGEDAHRGRGVGTSVLRRFLADVVFARPDVMRAIIAPEPANARAVRSYERAGFRHVKTVFVPDSGEHEYVMELTRADFETHPGD